MYCASQQLCTVCCCLRLVGLKLICIRRVCWTEKFTGFQFKTIKISRLEIAFLIYKAFQDFPLIFSCRCRPMRSSIAAPEPHSALSLCRPWESVVCSLSREHNTCTAVTTVTTDNSLSLEQKLDEPMTIMVIRVVDHFNLGESQNLLLKQSEKLFEPTDLSKKNFNNQIT